MARFHFETSFDLNYVKNYATPENAIAAVEKRLSAYLDAGVMFNVRIVDQRKGGKGTDAEDRRYVPILHGFRVPVGFHITATQVAINCGRAGFYSIA